MTRPLAGRVAMVTGASAGIGAATVRVLAEAGAVVHAVARRDDRLAALAEETECRPHAVDLTDPSARVQLAEVAPEILVNNAGLGAGITGLEGASLADIEQTVGTNLTAVLDLLRLCIPEMRARGRGHLVTLGSVAGVYPGPSAIYGATKSAVRMMGWNLRGELRGSGIRVTEILPGRVRTEFYDAAVPDPERRTALKETGIRELTAEDIADAILYAVTAPSHVNVSAIELQPLEQTFGGISFDPVKG
ncbi:MAG: SDR family oxidoreductase [Pseudomonadota bacterium]